MVIDKKEHQDFLIEAIRSIRFNGTLEELEELIRIGKEVLEAIENAEVRE